MLIGCLRDVYSKFAENFQGLYREPLEISSVPPLFPNTEVREDLTKERIRAKLARNLTQRDLC